MQIHRGTVVGFIVLLTAMLLGLMLGRYHLNVQDVLYLINLKIHNQPAVGEAATAEAVLWMIRLPRVLMAMLVGAALSVSGAVFQGLFRNPLVSPDILGVSAGAGFGAALAIILVGTSALAIQISAFAFALLAVLAAYQIGNRGYASITNLVLAGVIVSSLFTAGLSFLKYVADPYEQLPTIVFWTMGGLNYIVWIDVWRAVPLVAVGLILLYIYRWRLNLLAMGDEEAMTLGVNVRRARAMYIVLATLIAAICISACGSISWVGLVVPHIARMLVGPDHKMLIPFSALAGAVFMLAMDTLARTITGVEIPISIITSFVGAPFLAYLLLQQQQHQWHD